MKSDVSLPHLQQTATCPYPEPYQSSPCHPSHFLKIHLNILLPSMSWSYKWLFPSGFPTKTLYVHLLSPIHDTCPAHLILLDLITGIIFCEYRSLSSSLCISLSSLVTSSLLGPNIVLNTLFSYTLSLRSSLRVSDQV